MDLLSLKILVLTLSGALRLFFSLIPLKITKSLMSWGEKSNSEADVAKRKRQIAMIMSLILCFGGGILLATCFIHMLPEVRESLEQAARDGSFPDMDFPFAELFICCGFFLVYILEDTVHYIFIPSGSHGHSHGVPPPPPPPPPNAVEMTHQQRDTESGRQNNNVADGTNGAMTAYEHPDAMKWKKDFLTARVKPCVSQVHLLASSYSLNQTDLNVDNDVNIKATSVPDIPKLSHSLPIVSNAVKPDMMMNGDAHKHHHTPSFSMDDIKQKSAIAALRSFLFVLALSFHAIFEGMAIGLQMRERDVWFLFVAVSIHDCAILFCIGMELASSNSTKFLHLIVYLITLSLVSPLGVAIGILVTENLGAESAVQTLVIAILQGLAGGTILYITFFEVLGEEKKKETTTWVHLLFIIMGFAGMVGLEAMGGHDHGNTGQGNGHSHSHEEIGNHHHDHDHGHGHNHTDHHDHS